jgi:UDP-N-acetylglucosamine--N-acetylmuramyl-(pentapeptide) pyrophosphoryl-undecaprenol N-acetylglucosamine transferase
MKRILFTGGGSAGHVTVNLALIPHFIDEGWDVKYMGSKAGIEADLIKEIPKIEYIEITTGKLRRYFSWENIKDPFRIINGVFQAFRAIKKFKPNVVFSKGGFVSVPVVIAARLNKVPVIIHESDITPGLANKISAPYAAKVCYTFPETKQHLNSQKSIHVGAIIREELKRGNAVKGLHLCEFTQSKPVLLIMGGSQGAQKINQKIRNNLNQLLQEFQIVHICGKGQVDSEINVRGYKQYEYIQKELPDILAMSSVVISRAGSKSIFEFLALKIPMLLIPLSLKASRGDQILNAQSFYKHGYCEVLYEEEMTDEVFIEQIKQVYSKRQEIKENMSIDGEEAPLNKVINIITETAGRTMYK